MYNGRNARNGWTEERNGRKKEMKEGIEERKEGKKGKGGTRKNGRTEASKTKPHELCVLHPLKEGGKDRKEGRMERRKVH